MRMMALERKSLAQAQRIHRITQTIPPSGETSCMRKASN
jgi:hypothetical protein